MGKTKDNNLPRFLLEDNSKTAVLFIHGLGGGWKTWLPFANQLNIEWAEIDNFNLEYTEYYRSYLNIPVVSFALKVFLGKDIQKLSEHLNSVINSVCGRYENVILIGHSMGGLVARQYIVNKLKREKNLGKIKGLITYATPHLGSYLPLKLKILFYNQLKFISKSRLLQVNELSNGGEFINQLNKDWSLLNVEDKIDFIRVVGMDDWVVNIESASLKEDVNVHKFANKDHFNIIKPSTQFRDPALYISYNYLKDFYFNQEKKALLEETEDDI